MFLPLAERMVEKMVKEEKIEAEAEVWTVSFRPCTKKKKKKKEFAVCVCAVNLLLQKYTFPQCGSIKVLPSQTDKMKLERIITAFSHSPGDVTLHILMSNLSAGATVLYDSGAPGKVC